MHEMSLCEGIMQCIEDNAREEQYRHVRRVRLEVGQFACIEPDALRFCFDVVSRNTVAEGAELEIMTVWASTWCLACAGPVAITERHAPCPDCGSYQLQSQGGDELRIKDLEVD